MQKKWILIVLAAVIILTIPVALFAKRYYDNRYVLDDYFYTVVPLDYDLTPATDKGGRFTGYTLACFNAGGEERELSFQVLIDAHKSDLYPPGTFIRVSVSKQLVIGRRAVDEGDVPEKAHSMIRSGFAPSSAASLIEYAEERTRQLAVKNNACTTLSCAAYGIALTYTYVYDTEEKASAETAAGLLDPVYAAQFRTDKDAFPELAAIYLEVKLGDGTVIFSQKYDKRVEFDYEKLAAADSE